MLILYLGKFMIFDREDTIANAYNARQDQLAKSVIRGDVVASDGTILATTNVGADGSESRSYPFGSMYSHAVGYATQGKMGVELTANYYLLTSDANIIERTTNTLKDEKNYGNTVVTTLDPNLQAAAYNALGYGRGAVIAIEPSTGKILAEVSKPDFDPNAIDYVMETATTEGSDSVLLNRATQGLYPPGSTFKVLTTLEYLKEHPGDDSYHWTCGGEDVFESVTIHCYNNTAHGEESLADSLAYSCNTSFAHIGTQLDMAKFRKLCDKMMFNGALPYGGNYSQSSFVLDETTDRSLIPQTVIGQGDTLITPLHNAMIMCAIANGGVLMRPYMVSEIRTYQDVRVRTFRPKTAKRLMSADEAKQMTELLTGVVEYGTGYAVNTPAYTVAGKTGTAEYNAEGESHSWFVGFSNVEQPDLVVCVVIEEADISGIRAADVARQVFDAYH